MQNYHFFLKPLKYFSVQLVLEVKLLFFGFNPIAIIFNKLNESLHRFRLWNIFLNALFLFVERHLSMLCTDIAVIGIRHFSRTVYNATHHTNFQVF